MALRIKLVMVAGIVGLVGFSLARYTTSSVHGQCGPGGCFVPPKVPPKPPVFDPGKVPQLTDLSDEGRKVVEDNKKFRDWLEKNGAKDLPPLDSKNLPLHMVTPRPTPTRGPTPSQPAPPQPGPDDGGGLKDLLKNMPQMPGGQPPGQGTPEAEQEVTPTPAQLPEAQVSDEAGAQPEVSSAVASSELQPAGGSPSDRTAQSGSAKLPESATDKAAEDARMRALFPPVEVS